MDVRNKYRDIYKVTRKNKENNPHHQLSFVCERVCVCVTLILLVINLDRFFENVEFSCWISALVGMIETQNTSLLAATAFS